MLFLIEYIIKLSLSLAFVYLFYRFFLRPLTFYNWNRWYLSGYSMLAFFIPFVDINPMLESIGPRQAEVINFIPVLNLSGIKAQRWLDLSNRSNLVLIALISGMLVLGIRLIIQLYSYRRLKRSSTLISESPVRVFQVDRDIVPFSVWWFHFHQSR